jgi:predicted TPR repeat methyltransferase
MKIPKRTLKGPPRPSLAELTRMCLESLEKNELATAKQHCDQVLVIEPKNLIGRLLSARIEYRSGHFDSARSQLRSLCQEYPTCIEVWNDLCVVLMGNADYQQVKQTIAPALIATNHAPVLAEFYIDTLLKLQEPQTVVDYFDQHPHLLQSSSSLKLLWTEALRQQQQYDKAAQGIEQLLQELPNEENLYRRLVAIWRDAQDAGQLEQALKRWLTVSPNNPVALHLMGSIRPAAGTSVVRASDEYVKTVFDEFAATFDQALSQLDYQAPQHVQRLVQELIANEQIAASGLHVLDAGCGTGLCGPILKPLSEKLVGVDIAPKMLELARQRDIYDTLVEAELTQYLSRYSQENAADEAFDLIVICDTLNYFGDLRDVLQYAFDCLKPQGYLTFTIETLGAQDLATTASSFILAQHGRYLHAPASIEQLMKQVGFATLDSYACELRKQAGTGVAGTLFWARRGETARG